MENELHRHLLGGYDTGESASILRRAPGEIVFAVDNVEPAIGPLPHEDAATQIARRLDGELLISSVAPGTTFVKAAARHNPSCHPLVDAVHRAFSEHRSLCLTPDAIWLTIAQGFAQHVALHAEELRGRLVLHEGKERLTVIVRELTKPEHWIDAVEQWTEMIDARSHADAARLMVCDFSTTTPTIRTASQIVLMDALRHYFDCRLWCLCGIPQVTLCGTPEDWRNIRDRVDQLAGFDLEWWTDRVLPICDALMLTAEGQPPLTFWQDIYKPQFVYGDEVITGWLADLFPYVNEKVVSTPTRRNPILDVPRERITIKNGITEMMLPTGLSAAPFQLRLPDDSMRNLDLVGGFLGVVEKEAEVGTGVLEPLIGWGIRPGDAFAALLDSLLERAEEPLPLPSMDLSRGIGRLNASFPIELMRLLDAANGLTLRFDRAGAVRLLPVEEYQEVDLLFNGPNVHRANQWHMYDGIKFGETEDGRTLAFAYAVYTTPVLNSYNSTAEVEWWVLLGRAQEEKLPVGEAVVVARSIPLFCECLLASPDAPYFDSPHFTPECEIEDPEE